MSTLYENPWEYDQWNLTAQGKFLAKHGAALSAAYANDAGTAVGARKLRAPPKPKADVFIIHKKIVTNVSGSGSGSSGYGPPTG